jgi:hypothetical protein
MCDLDRPHHAWAFLVVHGLVIDQADERQTFLRILEQETPRNITGPSLARRVAMALEGVGVARPAALIGDPSGALAMQRFETIASWGPHAVTREQIDRVRRWHDMSTKARPAPRRQWWRLW